MKRRANLRGTVVDTFFEAIELTTIQEIEVDIEKQSCRSLIKDLSTAKLFLLGETHGVKENPDVIYTLFKKFGFKKLALEWNKNLQVQAEKFLSEGQFDFEVIKNSPDGRITAGHFALLKRLKDEGLLEALVCFDEETPYEGWDARDANMAKNVLANLSGARTLVVAGNLHTKVESFTFDDENTEYHPMGEAVKKQIPGVPSGKISYLTGQFHNFGVKDFEQKPGVTETTKAKFYRSAEGLYYFELPKAHPAVVPNPSKTL